MDQKTDNRFTPAQSFQCATLLCAMHLLLQLVVFASNLYWWMLAWNVVLTVLVWYFGSRFLRIVFSIWMYLSAILYAVMLWDCFDPVAATIWWKAAIFAVCALLCALLATGMLFLPAVKSYKGICKHVKNSRREKKSNK